MVWTYQSAFGLVDRQVIVLEDLVEVVGQEVGQVIEAVGGWASVSGCRVCGGLVKNFFGDGVENGACYRNGAY